jgi:argininosuccinate synthase
MNGKALLLYSGGLDTSVMIKWLQEKMGYEVSTLTLDVGQEKNNLKEIARKAKRLGAQETITRDVTQVFAEKYVLQGILSDGLYEGVYPLSTSLARPLMAKEAVEVAHFLDYDTIVHGSTGKGNDQVRFEVSIRALDDTLKVIAPVRDLNMNREDEIAYALKNGIDIPYGGKYSVDENLWGRSVEGADIEKINSGVPFDAFKWVTPQEQAGELPETVTIEFENGIPVSLDGTDLQLKELITRLNVIAGRNGVGSIDMIEDRVVGIKSHEFYECPAAITIISGHRYLERAVLNRKELEIKQFMDNRFADYVYNGLWFDPVMDHIADFEKSINAEVNGSVSLKLYKGNLVPMGVESQSAIYDIGLSSYGRNQTFDQSKSPGFIYVYGNETIVTRKSRTKTTTKNEIRVQQE